MNKFPNSLGSPSIFEPSHDKFPTLLVEQAWNLIIVRDFTASWCTFTAAIPKNRNDERRGQAEGRRSIRIGERTSVGREKKRTALCTITSRSTILLATWPPLSKRLRKTTRQLSDEIANRNVLRGQWKESRSASSITSPGRKTWHCNMYMYVRERERTERKKQPERAIRTWN